MSDRNHGGFAFPHPGSRTAGGDEYHVYPELGMTLRDYFAAQAMLEFCSWVEVKNPATMPVVARLAYEMADAMLAERAK
jgi:hypothetical protein